MARVKRWKPTRQSMQIIQQLAKSVADDDRPRVEIAERVNITLSDGESGMDLFVISAYETDLVDRYPISVLRSGNLYGRVHMTPLVELWVSTTEELKDQMYVQFDEHGDIRWVRLTSARGAILHEQFATTWSDLHEEDAA